ncbi:MAG: isochorismatase family protein [Planctomycetia bacterium]|nr:isochorismatase family protein [Planctomycetia bacterium]
MDESDSSPADFSLDLPLPRSPQLMSAADTGLLVVDVQEKLIPLVPGHAKLVWNIERLLSAAKLLGVPAAATEQYPAGLGPLVSALRQRLQVISEKLAFSCGGSAEVFAPAVLGGRPKILVCGIETHVCIQQTVLDLLAAGVAVYIAVDAVGARHAIDHETALRRMNASGAVLTTTEAAMFEWCAVAGTPQFRELSKLIRQPPPLES